MWLLVPLCATPFALQHFKVIPWTQPVAIGASAGAAVVVLALYFLGRQQGDKPANAIALELSKARKLHAHAVEKSDAHYLREQERIKIEFTNTSQRIDEDLERRQVERLQALRQRRDPGRWQSAINRVKEHARSGENLMPAILEAVERFATVGEIAAAMREVFGEYQESVVI